MRNLNVWAFVGLVAGSMLGMSVGHAQYKYTGPDGRTVYSDQPPPPSARDVQRRDYAEAGSRVDTANLPYEVRRAIDNFPVTLYTTPGCGTCDTGREALRKRGVPFVERIVKTNDDLAALKRLGLENRFPALTVGSTKFNDWNEQNWDSALTVAGYPTSSRLPSSYSNPPAEPLAPPPAAPSANSANNPTPSQPDRAVQPARPSNRNAPEGFRF